jgi:hypothetical protein
VNNIAVVNDTDINTSDIEMADCTARMDASRTILFPLPSLTNEHWMSISYFIDLGSNLAVMCNVHPTAVAVQ